AGAPDPVRPERRAAAERGGEAHADPGLAAAAEAGRGVDPADVVSGRQPAAAKRSGRTGSESPAGAPSARSGRRV
ncbi:MAG: hypothetical protein R6V44_06215, partial [Paracoccaceae bacterium]